MTAGAVVTQIISVIGALWLGIAGAWGTWAYVNAPVGWPNIHVLAWTISLPGAGVLTAADARIAAYAKAEADAKARAKVVETADAQTVASADRHDQQQQIVIDTRYRTLIREVHDVVTPDTDLRFPVPWGSVRLFNAGALGIDVSAVRLPTGALDGQASPVTASQLATATAANDHVCAATAQQLVDLQDDITAEIANHAQQPVAKK